MCNENKTTTLEISIRWIICSYPLHVQIGSLKKLKRLFNQPRLRSGKKGVNGQELFKYFTHNSMMTGDTQFELTKKRTNMSEDIIMTKVRYEYLKILSMP